MSLLYKIQRTLVTFSLTLMLKDRVPDIQTWKGTWYQKFLRNAERLEKCKLPCELFDYLNAKGFIFDHGRHGKKIKYKCLNEMKCLVYTLLYLVYTVLYLVLHH